MWSIFHLIVAILPILIPLTIILLGKYVPWDYFKNKEYQYYRITVNYWKDKRGHYNFRGPRKCDVYDDFPSVPETKNQIVLDIRGLCGEDERGNLQIVPVTRYGNWNFGRDLNQGTTCFHINKANILKIKKLKLDIWQGLVEDNTADCKDFVTLAKKKVG